MPKSIHDMQDTVIQIVRDAIEDGLIRTERLKRFNKRIRALKGKELEDYLQKLWDQI